MKDFWDTLGGIVLVTLGVVLSYVLYARTHPEIAPVVPAPQPVKPAQKPELFYVSASNCVWCQKMERETLADAEVKDFIAKNFAFTKTSDRSFAKKHRIYSFPAYLILSPSGVELSRGTGWKSREEFLQWMSQSRKGSA